MVMAGTSSVPTGASTADDIYCSSSEVSAELDLIADEEGLTDALTDIEDLELDGVWRSEKGEEFADEYEYEEVAIYRYLPRQGLTLCYHIYCSPEGPYGPEPNHATHQPAAAAATLHKAMMCGKSTAALEGKTAQLQAEAGDFDAQVNGMRSER